MEKIINLGIPHVAEQIFESIDTPGLIKCLEVSETWRVFAENVLIKRWKGKMFEACKNGETKVVQLLLERCNSEESGLHIRDDNGRTTLMIACIIGDKDVVQSLLDNSEINIDLNARNHWEETALMVACKIGNRDVVQLLLDNQERNIDLNAKNWLGWTAFMIACLHGHKDVVKLLLDNSERNIDFNARDNIGYTVLNHACIKRQKDVVRLLLHHPAAQNIILDARDNIGHTALTIAEFRNQHNSAPGAQSRTTFRKKLKRFKERALRLLTRLRNQ